MDKETKISELKYIDEEIVSKTKRSEKMLEVILEVGNTFSYNVLDNLYIEYGRMLVHIEDCKINREYYDEHN